MTATASSVTISREANQSWLLAPLQQDLQAPDPEDEQDQPLPVHPVRHLDVVVRLRHVPPGQHAGEHAERQVDVEDPGPGIVVGDPAAQGRAEGGPDHHAHAEDGHGRAGLARGKTSKRMACAVEISAPPPMPCTMRQKTRSCERGRMAAEERCEGEEGDRAGVVVAPPEPLREPAGERQDDDVRHDVAGAHPGDLLERGAEVPHHVRDRDVHDAGVHQLEHARQRDRERDQVPRPVHLGARELLPAAERQGDGTHAGLSGSGS